MRSFAVLGVFAVAAAGCASRPPAGWAQGGTPMVLPAGARWERGDRSVDLLPDGRVLVDGDPVFTVDRAGRVFEPSGDPIALLAPDGRLVGTDDRGRGHVGTATASPPHHGHAWIGIGPRGEVTYWDDDGEAHPQGGWSGCAGPGLRTCTLVTHLVTLLEVERRPRVGFGIGIGMGFHR